MVHKCSECANGIFDKTWGEYKCKVTGIVEFKSIHHDGCEDYKTKKKGNK